MLLKSTRNWKRRRALIDPPEGIGSHELAIHAINKGKNISDAARESQLSKRQIGYHAGKFYSETARVRDFEIFGDELPPLSSNRKPPTAAHLAALQLALHHPDDRLNDLIARLQSLDIDVPRSTLARLLRKTGLATPDARRAAALALAEHKAEPVVWLAIVGTINVIEDQSANMLLFAVREATGYIWGEVMHSYEPAALGSFILNHLRPSMRANGHANLTIKTALVENIGDDQPLSTMMPGLSALTAELTTVGISLRSGEHKTSFGGIEADIVAIARHMQFEKLRQQLHARYFSSHREASAQLASLIAAWNTTPHWQLPCLGYRPTETMMQGISSISS